MKKRLPRRLQLKKRKRRKKLLPKTLLLKPKRLQLLKKLLRTSEHENE
jgi:hypothetical protein